MEIENHIPFNKPFLTGNEVVYIEEAVKTGKISGNGLFTKKCQQFFEKKYKFKKCLMTTSCTDALEMTAILSKVKKGDEVIIPSYTFVSTALPFIRQGATVVFADSEDDNPNLDVQKIRNLITDKTKVIVTVHYAGISCDMDAIMELAKEYDLLVIEDAAQGIDSFYNGRPLGSIGHMAAFSFHETKNIIAGEGGLLIINDDRFIERAEIIWEKGTNRASFFRGEVNKYGWVDIGSSFLPSEIISAFLFAQLENLDKIQAKRKLLWNHYYDNLIDHEEELNIKLPNIPSYASNNAHMFFIVCSSIEHRDKLINRFKANNISAVFHYLSLHSSEYFNDRYNGENLPNADHFSNCLLRLPLFFELELSQVKKIIRILKS